MRIRLGDREVPVPPPLQAVHLVVTSDQVLNARGNKAIGFLPIHPLDLLEVTTSSNAHLEEIATRLPDRKGKKLTLADYNRFAEEGEANVPPFLRVDMETGKVRSHEGRHRAGALYREDPDALMWVAIEVLENGYAVYYEEDPKTYIKTRYLDGRDVPTMFLGQFRPTSVEVDPSTMWLIPRPPL